MDSKGFYKLLGLEPGASIAEVSKAYKKKQIELHPSGRERQRMRLTPEYLALTEEQKAAKENELDQKVAVINEAFNVLGDESKKQQYDSGSGEYGSFGDMGGFGAEFGAFSDIFSHFASGGRRQKKEYKVKDIDSDIKITYKDVFLGKKAKYRIKCLIICTGCSGKGGKNYSKCSRCKGQGAVMAKISFMGAVQTECADCKGEGMRISDPKCSECKGEKLIPDEKIIEVNIKPGTKHGEKICYNGQGNQYPGCTAGDVVFNILIADKDVYQRIEDDFICPIDIDILTVLSGGVVYFDHLDGRKLAIKVDAFKNLENAICIPNEGFRSTRTGRRGDLYLKPNVLINSGLDRAKLCEYLKPLISKPSGQYTNAMSTLSKLPQKTPEYNEDDEESRQDRFYSHKINISDIFSGFQ